MAQTIQRQWVSIPVENGGMEAYLAQPSEAGPWPAVIVLMEIFGVNSHIQEVAERIAAEGYVAIAPNYYHRTTPNMTLNYTDADIAVGRKHKEQATRQGILADLQAAIQFLQASNGVFPKERLGCVGFCFGGHVAYIAAGLPSIAATAAFYPGGVAVTSPGGGPATVTHTPEITGEVLCLFGEQDPLIPHQETVIIEKALQNAGIRHEIVRYSNTGHGFFCNQRADYDASSADDAWHRLKSLFARTLR